MDRKKEILALCEENKTEVVQLVDEIIFLEDQLIKLKKLPFISVNPKNQAQQRATPAAKQYKEFLQQYINCIKLLIKASGQDDDEEESPLRKWARKRISRC